MIVAPRRPVIFNGVVFAASSGEYRAPADVEADQPRSARSGRCPQCSTPWIRRPGRSCGASGKTITSFARAGISAAAGQVYVVTFDNTLYAFGIPMEH